MKTILCLLCGVLICIASCKKGDDQPADDFTVLEQQVLDQFVDGVAIPQYADLAVKADVLRDAVETLHANATDTNLVRARNAWLSMRTVWEQCEGFLFGPVEDSYYDPYMDTWPTDYVQMDSLLQSSSPLALPDIRNFTLSLRGFHPIEYLIFGNHGDRTASSLTPRQMEYMVSLSADLQANCHALSESWDAGGYGALVKTAGRGSSKYAGRKEIFVAMADGLTEICEEVGDGKMKEPYDQQDARTVESPYSGSSVSDFRNNITGLENVYLGRYATDGKGLSDLVAAGNAALDQKIRGQITTAISSFGNITHFYEQAIFDQKVQIQQTQAALSALAGTLDGELKPYIIQHIKD